MPKNYLKVIEKTLLYSKKKVELPTGEDRRKVHTAQGAVNKRTDKNLTQRITKFAAQLQNTYYYRIPLKYICSLGLVNTPVKFNTKWRINFESKMQRLFESNANLAAGTAFPNTVDSKIILDSAPYLPYQQFSLEDTYRTYLESAMVPNQTCSLSKKL